MNDNIFTGRVFKKQIAKAWKDMADKDNTLSHEERRCLNSVIRYLRTGRVKEEHSIAIDKVNKDYNDILEDFINHTYLFN
jgi:hypothetical protein